MPPRSHFLSSPFLLYMAGVASVICRPPSVCNMPQAENHPINWAEGRALHAAEPTVIVSGKKAVAAMTCPGAVPLKTARMSTGVTIKQDSANMPSAVAEAPAAARYVADVWRLNAASRLQTQMESKRGTARLN